VSNRNENKRLGDDGNAAGLGNTAILFASKLVEKDERQQFLLFGIELFPILSACP
jgi:hypothetical protein